MTISDNRTFYMVMSDIIRSLVQAGKDDMTGKLD